MPRKTSDQHQNNSRLGALGESLVQTFLLEYADFCYPTQEKHPADLCMELNNSMYTIQVRAGELLKKRSLSLLLRTQGQCLKPIKTIVVIF